jgi:hypothetical protein
MPSAYVKPYVKRGTSDAADAVVNVRYWNGRPVLGRLTWLELCHSTHAR